jgi:hypothetical protein
MSFKYCLLLALAPCVAQAQQSDPADAQARVPAAPHVSAFKDYRSADYPTTTPDLAWRFANARVASEAGGAMHAGMHVMDHVEVKTGVNLKTKVDPHADHPQHAVPAAPTDHSHHEGH